MTTMLHCELKILLQLHIFALHVLLVAAAVAAVVAAVDVAAAAAASQPAQ